MVNRSTRFAVEALGSDLGYVVPSELTEAISDWPPFYRANWRNPSAITVTHSWLTDVVSSKDLQNEERRGLWERPVRDFSVELSGLSQTDSIRLQNFCMRAGTDRQPMPIYPDKIKTLQTSTGKILNASIGWKRFYKGQRIALVKPDYTPWSVGGEAIFMTIERGSPEFGTRVEGYTDDQIFLSSNLPETIPKGTLVFPMIDAQYVQRTSGFVLTDTLSTFAFKYQEMNGMNTLPSSWEGEMEASTPYAYGYPVLQFRPNFKVQYGLNIIRPMQRARSGRTSIVDVDGDRPYFGLEFAVSSASRRASWEVLQFFDSRRGRLKPFFLKSTLKLIKLVSIDASTATVELVGRGGDFVDFFKYVIMTYDDGSVEVRTITKLTLDVIQFDATIPSPSSVVNIDFCFFGRFDTDRLKQIWRTDNYCDTGFVFRELPNEHN